MNVPMSWLKDYVDIDCDIKTFIDGMTMSGTKVEGYEELGKEISNVVVGKILSIESHPDADKLVVTQVDVGEQTIQIVTGADNIAVGDYIPVALHGSTLPGGVKIKKGKLRGIESNGMMCSVQELGFEAEDFPEAPEHGIYIFPDEQPLGIDVKPLFGLDDTVVEYEITSNRPDCYSIVGIAREAAATFHKPFKYPRIEVKESAGNVDEMASVEIQNQELCPRYAARIIKNVKIAPSPKWMQKRLLAAGVRPINNIVDITNYIMLEMGQPMHAFDLDQLEEKRIVVRNAKEGEVFSTLDGVERKLDPSMLMIADGEKAVAIAGVMGGENSKVTEDTKTILFESANFNGTNVRLTAKKLGLRTDASSKYEKGLDPNNVVDAVNRAAQLIVELGAGEVVTGMIDQYPAKREPLIIPYSPEKINKLLGISLSENEMIKIFERVECKVNKEKKEVSAPTFRPDLEREADLAEEVARLYGYDQIPTTLAIGTPTVGKKNSKQKMEDLARDIMEAQGLSEAMSYSFESPKVFGKLNIPDGDSVRNAIVVSNPLGEDFSIMRTTTLNGMLQSLATNYNRRNPEAGLYEMGMVYLPKNMPLEELPDERMQLTIGMYGKTDFYHLKGIVEELIEKVGLNDQVAYVPEKEISWMHPGRCANIMIGEEKLGVLGEIHPTVAENYDIETRVYVANIDMPCLVENARMDRSYLPLPKFPAVTRDLAILVKEDIIVKQIEDMVKQRGGKLLESYQLFDVYQGEQIEKGFKSVAYSITFRAGDHTLTDDEVSKIMKKILNGLETQLGAKLR